MSKGKSISTTKKTSGGFSSLMSVLAIVISLVAGVLIYKYIFGDPGNFVDNDPNGEPLDGSLLATIYKGGFIVPILEGGVGVPALSVSVVIILIFDYLIFNLRDKHNIFLGM